MRRSLIAFLALTVGMFLTVGCGSKSVINTNKMTEDEIREMQENDRRIADEESHGHANKAKKGGR